MHISDGILPLSWAILWGASSISVIAIALTKFKKNLSDHPDKKAFFVLITAFIFLISTIPIPIPFAGTCSHPVGVGVGVLTIGLSGSFLAGFIVLLLQALFLAHGGISTLGANVFSMAIVGSFSAYIILQLIKDKNLPLFVKGFLVGIVADWMTYISTATQLALALKENDSFLHLFTKILLAFLPIQGPLSILEGIITASLLIALAKRRKDLLEVSV
ncbi:MAG: energy-coupling factor ABC transporter permease [Caldimicrobium sp.]